MGPEALAQVLRPLHEIFALASPPELLSGLDEPDDAAVWRLDAERAIVLTADFFPPVVDDPYHYGAIAAANSLSDVYAMGADPLFAINLVGFPDNLEPEILAEILRGGADKIRQAGAVIAGGHTVVDQEPKYGLAVLGIVHPDRILGKGGALPGDALLLTKPLGTGLITTAHKRGKVAEGDLAAAIESMEHLSRDASRILRSFAGDVHALTDVTGFGLAGHAHEMAHQSRVSLGFRWSDVPILPGSEKYARDGMLAGGLTRNEKYYTKWARFSGSLPLAARVILFDPQTSGGLLAAVAPEALDGVLAAFKRAGERVFRIGEVLDGAPGGIEVS